MSGDTVSTEGDWLVVEPLGADKIWTFTRRLRVPIDSIAGVRRANTFAVSPVGWRGPGLRVPGKVSGTYRRRGTRRFFNIDRRRASLIIELENGGRLSSITIGVEDPSSAVTMIEAARSRR